MRKLLAVLLSLWLCAPVYAQQSKSALTTEINTDFADNTTGAITAALLRTVSTDIVNSYVDWLTCTGTGGIIYYSGGTPTCRTAGVDGQVLVFNGVPTWQYITAGTISGSVTNATNATNLTTTNDTTTNATYYPTFQTASGGTNPLKTSNAKLTYNPSTGRLSATDFAGTFNGNTLTAGTFTITGVAGKTFTFNKNITLEGTDGTTWTGPSTNATLASLNIASQVLTGGAIVTAPTAGSGSFTVNCGLGPLQSYTNGAAATITAPANDGSCIIKSTNNASAGALTFSGFTVSANTGDSLTTTNGNIFYISIVRIGGTANYIIRAAQ